MKYKLFKPFIKSIMHLRFRKILRKSGGVPAKNGENRSSEPVKNTSNTFISSSQTPISQNLNNISQTFIINTKFNIMISTFQFPFSFIIHM